MKKIRIFKRKNFMKINTIVIVLLFTFILVSGSSISLTLKNISTSNNYNFKEIGEKISNGLASRNRKLISQTYIKINDKQSFLIEPLDDRMYGYNAYDSSGQLLEGPVWFIFDDPGTIEQIAPTQSDDFIAGATYTGCDKRWLGCENGSGKIWEIDIDTGEMTLVGGGGENLNSLAFDPFYNRCYGSGDDNYLYEIDIYTGEQTQIGAFGSGVQYMIGMAFSLDGVLYGWDLGNDKLWTIDTDTGEATEVGPLGIDLNYAQDGAFDYGTGTLWLTAYNSSMGGFLAYYDLDTEELEVIDNFQGGAQITGSIILNEWLCPEHDMALKNIDYPETGPATPNMDMQITVRNEGNNTETFDAQMEIINYQPGALLMEEGFEGDFPPEGWETDSWTQCYNNCSPDPPCACAYKYDQEQYYDNNITSKAVNASEYKKCNLGFYFGADLLYPQYCSFYVKYRRNENDSWKDITPWDNPLGGYFEGGYTSVSIVCFPEHCGEALQIKWEYIGYYYYYNYFVLDSVTIEGCNSYEEYAEVVEDITLAPGKKMEIEFPPWTPPQWQDPEFENTWVNYLVHAFVMLNGDHNPSNDKKEKLIDLYFGFFHDVGCNNVSRAESGPAQTLPVTGHIKNFGQYNESGFKTYIEISELDNDNFAELITEDFSDSTFPPNAWTKTHNNWMYSSTNYAGGTTGEARFYYYPYSTDIFRLYTPLLNTSEFEIIEIEFKHFVDHFFTPYILKLETSQDGINWDTLWKIEPTENVGPELINILTDKNIGSNLYVSWTFDGISYNIDNWYIDDIIIKGYNLVDPEYEDELDISTIEPGEELEVNFNDWTPEFLQYETTGIKKYIVKAWTQLENPTDQNPDNDLFKKLITLDYFHDVGIKNISSPSIPCNSCSKSKTYAPPMPEIYIPAGTEDIDVIVENNGTFPELDLYGTKVYSDEIADIDLEEPVGGTKLLNFDDYTFVDQGVYALYCDLPLEIDDFPENNEKDIIIGVDDSGPYSWIEEIDPPEPDGENGWYVSDVEVTICAEDPEIAPGIPGSGVCGFFVLYNGGSGQFIPGNCITIIIGDDGNDILIEYWAVDCVDNLESTHHSFTIDMDQTVPKIDLTYEVSGNKWLGWEFIFTATATDIMSGMDYVEFYLNEVLQETIIGPGPEYTWTIRYEPLPRAIFTATAYDKAGLFSSDEIIDPRTNTHSYSKNSQILSKISLSQYSFNLLLLRLFERFTILHQILDDFGRF